MAPRRMTPAQRRRAAEERPQYRCRDCANSYDWHSEALDGHLILCRCPHKQQGGKFCIFLSDYACKEHFKLRDDGQQQETR